MTFLREAGGLSGVSVVPRVPVKKERVGTLEPWFWWGWWVLSYWFIYIKYLVVVVVVERKWRGSKVPVKKERFPFCKKLLVVHLVFPLSCSHNFLGSLLLKNTGTLEPWNRTSKKPCKSSTYTVPIFCKKHVSPERETLNSGLGLEPYQFP